MVGIFDEKRERQATCEHEKLTLEHARLTDTWVHRCEGCDAVVLLIDDEEE